MRRLKRTLLAGGVVYRAGTAESDIAKTVNRDDVWDESPAGEQADEPVPYAKWKKDDLETEVARRNADRGDDDAIVVGGKGTVKDLAAALDADDAAQA